MQVKEGTGHTFPGVGQDETKQESTSPRKPHQRHEEIRTNDNRERREISSHPATRSHALRVPVEHGQHFCQRSQRTQLLL